MLRWLAVAPCLVLLGCTGTDPYSPGTPVGTFNVSAKLTSLSCGGSAPDPWTFDVKVNHDARTVYWIQGGIPISATVATDGHATFAAQTVTDVRAATAKVPGCAITRTDSLGVYLVDGSAKPTADPAELQTFEGTLSYSFTATEGSDCSDQLAAAGGTWEALPCTATYTVKGTLAP